MKKLKLISGWILWLVTASSLASAPVVDYSSDAESSAYKAKSFSLKTEDNIAPSSFGASSSLVDSKANLNLEQRLSKIENQVTHLNEQNLAGKVEELQQRLQKLNGQFEDQAHQIEALNIQLKEFYQDLNQRLEGGKGGKPGVDKVDKSEVTPSLVPHESQTAPAKSATGILPATSDNIAEVFAKSDNKKEEKGDEVKQQVKSDSSLLKEQQLYQTAIDLLPDKKYEASESKLRSYLKLYPQGAYVANAHYWLGEINFIQKNFDAAEEEFKLVMDKHAKSKRISDAMFKLALVHQHQGREVQAKKELQQVMKRYPGTSAAVLAKQQLAGG